MFVQKRRWNSDYIHVLLDELWKYSCLWSTHGQDSCTVTYKQLCLIRTLITQKIYLYTVVSKSGRWYRSCNWGNPLLTSGFLQWYTHECSTVGVSYSMNNQEPYTTPDKYSQVYCHVIFLMILSVSSIGVLFTNLMPVCLESGKTVSHDRLLLIHVL